MGSDPVTKCHSFLPLFIGIIILLGVSSVQGQALPNVALLKYTFNSTSYMINWLTYLTSFLAVDGFVNFTDTSYSCSMTNEVGGQPNWIGVDLEIMYHLKYVVVYSGKNIYVKNTANNLDNFIVGVTNKSLKINPPIRGTYDLCAQYPGTVALKQRVELNCSSTTPPARYVILQQPAASTGYLSVCELEVYGAPYELLRRNLLLLKPATSSSDFSLPCPAANTVRFVDGSHDTFFENCHCSQTNDLLTAPNWFMVDMLSQYYVDKIILTAREIFSYIDIVGHRLDNFIIGFSNVHSSISPPIRDKYPMCGRYPGYVTLGSKVEMKCNANLPKFRYLIAQGGPTSSDGYLTICELEAYETLDRGSFLWKKTANMTLNGFQFSVETTRSLLDCIYRCTNYQGCDSVNFKAIGAKLCELNKHPFGYTSLSFNVSWAFYAVFYY